MARDKDRFASIFVLGSFVAACCAKVEHLPLRGESLRADAFTLEAGGKGFNLMVAARRLGISVDGLLPVGGGFLAGLASPALHSEGLPLSVLRHYDGETGSGIGFIDAEGETSLAVYPGANFKLSVAEIRAAGTAIRHAKVVLAQFEIPNDPIAEAFAIARGAGATTILNPSPYRLVPDEILASTSIVIVNRVEALRMIHGVGNDAAKALDAIDLDALAAGARRLLDQGPHTVVVTLGKEGAFACRRGCAPLHQPAFAVDAVDTLGAGDAFSAGLAAALIEGRPFAQCLQRAAACGALATRRLGVLTALPTAAELDQFLAP